MLSWYALRASCNALFGLVPVLLVCMLCCGGGICLSNAAPFISYFLFYRSCTCRRVSSSASALLCLALYIGTPQSPPPPSHFLCACLCIVAGMLVSQLLQRTFVFETSRWFAIRFAVCPLCRALACRIHHWCDFACLWANFMCLKGVFQQASRVRQCFQEWCK